MERRLAEERGTPPRRFLRRQPWSVWGAGLSPAPERDASPSPLSAPLPLSSPRPRPPPPASLLRRCRLKALGIGFSRAAGGPTWSRLREAAGSDPRFPTDLLAAPSAISDGAGRDAARLPENHAAYAEESSQEAGDAVAAAGLHLRHPLLRLVYVQPALQTG